MLRGMNGEPRFFVAYIATTAADKQVAALHRRQAALQQDLQQTTPANKLGIWHHAFGTGICTCVSSSPAAPASSARP
ncbi:hypothetical protein EMIT047CA2_100196 [Pseudomonas soli]